MFKEEPIGPLIGKLHFSIFMTRANEKIQTKRRKGGDFSTESAADEVTEEHASRRRQLMSFPMTVSLGSTVAMDASVQMKFEKRETRLEYLKFPSTTAGFPGKAGAWNGVIWATAVK